MLFWMTCTVLAAVCAAYVFAPLMRGEVQANGASDADVYKAQLAEIERDLERGIVDPSEAEATRTEIARRLLAAHKSQAHPVRSMARSPRLAAIGAVVLLAGSGAGYFALGAVGEPDQPLAQRLALANEMRENRPSQTELVAAAPEPAPVDAPEEYLASIEQLRQIVPTRPDDLRGWELLAFHETELRNYSAAVAAQQRVMELKPDITPEDQRLLVDLMVAAADGYVSPETEVIVREMLAENEGNITGLYYLGALYNQTDRPDLAFRFWRPLVDSGEDTFHIALARAQIENAAARAGIEYSVPSFAGPDLDQITNAEGMSAEDRAAMIGDMVGRLSDRLATEGGPPVEWARLIRAYGVLGQTDDARTVWLEAQEVFGTSEDAMATLTEAASSAGLLE